MRFGVAVLMIVLVSTLAVADNSKPVDTIHILFVEPPGPVTRGVETEFVVDVEADLKSVDEGVAHVGFNSESPKKYRMEDSHLLGPGSQRFTFKVKVIAPDWGDRAKFTVMVNMGARSDNATWAPTAWETREIEVHP